jgi:hypothetical protein
MPNKTNKKSRKSMRKKSMKKTSSCFGMFGGDGAADNATRVFGGPSQQVAVGAGSNAIKILNDANNFGVAEPMKGGSNLSPADFAISNNGGDSYTKSVYGDMSQQSANASRGNEIAIINNPSDYQQMKGGMKILRNGDELEVSNDYVLAEGETIIPENSSETTVYEEPLSSSSTIQPLTISTPNPVLAPQPASSSFLSNISNFFNPNTKQSEVVAEKVVVEEKKQSGGKSFKKYTPAVLLYANPLYKIKKGKTQRKRKMRSTKK